MKSVAITYTSHINRLIACSAVGIALSLLLYGVFLLEAVAHTAARAEAEEEMVVISSRLAVLEEEYLEKTRAISPARAAEFGLTEPVSVTTVYATSFALTLLRGKERIPR
jgi:hypothetical protein